MAVERVAVRVLSDAEAAEAAAAESKQLADRSISARYTAEAIESAFQRLSLDVLYEIHHLKEIIEDDRTSAAIKLRALDHLAAFRKVGQGHKVAAGPVGKSQKAILERHGAGFVEQLGAVDG